MSIQIEKGIPVPHFHNYPFSEMEVGDSFRVPDGINPRNVRVYMQKAKQAGKGKFSMRTLPDGIRVWRIA